MSNQPNLDDYIEVNERIIAFYEKYPEGSLQGEWEVTKLGDQQVIVYTAKAYRKPLDHKPCIGTASEPIPGKTPYTKDSELMNCETSAWGRALAALGFEVKRGIASRNEVAARNGGDTEKKSEPKKGFASDKQRGLFRAMLAKHGGLDNEQVATCEAYAEATWAGTRGGGIGRMIDRLKNEREGAVEKTAQDFLKVAKDWQAKQTDLPAPATEGLGEPEESPLV
jgi:hypothetical protein